MQVSHHGFRADRETSLPLHVSHGKSSCPREQNKLKAKMGDKAGQRSSSFYLIYFWVVGSKSKTQERLDLTTIVLKIGRKWGEIPNMFKLS